MKYAVMGRNSVSTYWTLERCTRTKFMAILWSIIYRFRYDKTEIRDYKIPKEI